MAAVATVRPRPQSLPAFVGGGVGVPSIAHSPTFVVHGVGASSAVLSSASRGGGDSQNKYASTTEEESDIIVQQHQQQRGTGGRKDEKFN